MTNTVAHKMGRTANARQLRETKGGPPKANAEHRARSGPWAGSSGAPAPLPLCRPVTPASAPGLPCWFSTRGSGCHLKLCTRHPRACTGGHRVGDPPRPRACMCRRSPAPHLRSGSQGPFRSASLHRCAPYLVTHHGSWEHKVL